MAGLSLTSAITIMQDVFLFARYSAALEKAMISVERIREYEEISQESSTDDGQKSLFVAPPPKEANGWTTTPAADKSRVRDGPLDPESFRCNDHVQLPMDDDRLQEGGGTISFVDVVSRLVPSNVK